MTLEELNETWTLSAYQENSAEELDYFLNERACKVKDTAYLYARESGTLTKLEIIHIICNLDDMDAYDRLLENEDVLLDGETAYQADTSCEFITDHACYLVWFRCADQ